MIIHHQDEGVGTADAEPSLGEDDTLVLPSADGVPVPCPQPVIRPAARTEASNPTTVR